MAKKVYGVIITENYYNDVTDSNESEFYFDTTRVWVSKQRALEHMKRIALMHYKGIVDEDRRRCYDGMPEITYNHDSTIDVCTGSNSYKRDDERHYEVVEMELDEEE